MNVDHLYNEEYFRRVKPYASKPSRVKRYFKKIVGQKPEPRRILDVACGHGFLVKYLREAGYEAVGLDFSEFAGSEIPKWFVQHDARNPLPFGDKEFDVVISTGFLEHLEEHMIDFVYGEMRRVGKVVIAEIGFTSEPGAMGTHLTVKPRDWWYEKCPGIKLL